MPVTTCVALNYSSVLYPWSATRVIQNDAGTDKPFEDGAQHARPDLGGHPGAATPFRLHRDHNLLVTPT